MIGVVPEEIIKLNSMKIELVTMIIQLKWRSTSDVDIKAQGHGEKDQDQGSTF